jgi:hypothetical protein
MISEMAPQSRAEAQGKNPGATAKGILIHRLRVSSK